MIIGVVMSTTTISDAMPVAVRVNYYRYYYKNDDVKTANRHFRQMDLVRIKNRIYKITRNTNIYNSQGKKIGSSKKGNYMIIHSNKIYRINGKNYYYMQKIQKLNELYISDQPLRDGVGTAGYVRIENVGSISGGQYIVGQTKWGETFNPQMPITNICKNYNITKVTKFWNIELPKVG